MSIALITGPYPGYRASLAQLLDRGWGIRKIQEARRLAGVPSQEVARARLLICCAHPGQADDFDRLPPRSPGGKRQVRLLLTEHLGRVHRRWLARGTFDLVLPMTLSLDESGHFLRRLLAEDNPVLGYQALDLPHLQAGFEPDLEDLTRGEQRVLNHLQQGLSNEAIADRLAITINTVKVHLARICRKTGAQNRTQVASLVCQLPAGGC